MKRYLLGLSILALAAVSAQAQSFQQALFLDGYRLGYRYNPALQNEEAFLSVGQWESQSRSNYGAASFLYPRGDELVTALHSSVSAEEFLGSLNPDNYSASIYNYNLVSYGWRKGPAYHSLEANVRVAYTTSIPIEIFSILKRGTGEVNYDLSGIGISQNAIAELAYGYSRKLSDMVSVGARAKLMLGIESANYRISRMNLTLSDQVYQVDIEADMNVSSGLRKMRTDEDGYLNLLDMSAKDRWRLPSGVGLALDLGVVVTPLEGLTLSASVLDLGRMLWYYGNAGQSKGTTVFEGVDQVTLDELSQLDLNSLFGDQLNSLLESFKMKPIKDRVTLEAIPAHINLGARYELPFYRPLFVGASGNFILMKGMSYGELRGAVAWNPWEWLGVTANCGAGTYGAVWGVAANVAYKRFRLTLGYNNGFGGTVPYTGTALKANNKSFVAGLTYDL